MEWFSPRDAAQIQNGYYLMYRIDDHHDLSKSTCNMVVKIVNCMLVEDEFEDTDVRKFDEEVRLFGPIPSI